MDIIIFTLLGIVFVLLAAGVWVGISLMASAVSVVVIFTDLPVGRLFAQYAYNMLTTAELVALPLFILMGEFLFRTKLSQGLFNGLAPWAALLPGRLLHVNIIGSTIFASISGSSAATTQVIGRMSLTELLRRGYSPDIATGSLAGAGTLGFLIPPSTVMIIYGVLADQSILRLFAAGLIPGVLLAMCFMAWIMIVTTVRPELVPDSERALRHVSLRERLAALKELAPVLFLILCVLGSMYGGLATPSEAAALGAIGSALVAWMQGVMSWRALREVIMGTVQTSCMMGLIIIGATILGNVCATAGIPDLMADFVNEMQLSPFMLIVALLIMYLILGCFLEGFSMIVTTLPVALPLVTAAGFDPVWYGIFLVLAVEMAQITPPLGFNFFVIKALTGHSISYLFRVTLPFLTIMIVFVLLLAVFPEVALWLPDILYGKSV
jgi:tripartite ATP-independent transporter DctM subunit